MGSEEFMDIQKIEVDAKGIITNCYLVIKDNYCLIIDPGAEYPKIKNEIERQNLIPICVLVTHYHFDHIDALQDIKNTFKIPVIDYKTYINDEEIISIGNFDFNIISTKGHSKDSVSYYFFKNLSFFCGDFIFLEDIGRCDLQGGSETKMKESLKKLITYPNDMKIFPGHDESTDLKHEKENNKYLKEVMSNYENRI